MGPVLVQEETGVPGKNVVDGQKVFLPQFYTNIKTWQFYYLYIHMYTHVYINYYKITRVLCTVWLDGSHFLSEYRDTVDVIFILYQSTETLMTSRKLEKILVIL